MVGGDTGLRPRSARIVGLTLIELIIVLSIIGVLLALLLPAVQASREAARRLICQTQIRSWTQANHAYLATRLVFPPAASWREGEAPDGRPVPARHSLFAYLLPFVEQQSLANQIDLTRDWNDPRNDPWTHTDLRDLFVCPSAPGHRPGKHPSDYTTAVRVDPAESSGLGGLLRRRVLRNRSRHSGPFWGAGEPCWEGLLTVDEIDYVRGLVRRGSRRPEQVTDGLSHTAFLFENAGKPLCYRFGRPADCHITRFRWASPTIWMTLNDWCGDQQLVNCHNNSQPYGFHPGGLNWAMADGSVRFVTADMSADQIVSFVTSQAGD